MYSMTVGLKCFLDNLTQKWNFIGEIDVSPLSKLTMNGSAALWVVWFVQLMVPSPKPAFPPLSHFSLW